MNQANLSRLERTLGYVFDNKKLLELSLTHRSYKGENNERLEFLGDSILSFVIAEYLYERFPTAREGQLSRLRASLVKGKTLAELGKEFSLGDYLRLGSGELKSGGFRRESILADAIEAIIGAIYLDSGHDKCRAMILEWFRERLANLDLSSTDKDPKTRLQEYLQARKLALPEYSVLKTEGEAHDQTFTVSCTVESMDQPTKGVGSSRRNAEQQAAGKALDILIIK